MDFVLLDGEVSVLVAHWDDFVGDSESLRHDPVSLQSFEHDCVSVRAICESLVIIHNHHVHVSLKKKKNLSKGLGGVGEREILY